MYGDHLVESVRGVETRPAKTAAGWSYNMPGALTPEQVVKLIPKDILIFNWFWHDHRAAEGRGEPNDVKLSEWGFEQAHANFTPAIQNYARRTGGRALWAGPLRRGPPPTSTLSGKTSCTIFWVRRA